MAQDDKAAPSGGDGATKQYYRFRVQTADGKEMTSAVAEVDLATDGDLQNDPATDDEAVQLWADSGTFTGKAWFEPFGFRQGMLDPKTGEAPSPQEAIAQGYALVGTVDTVTRSLEALKKKLPVNWIFGWTHNMLVPHAKLMKSIELFKTKVLPRVS